MDQTGSQPSKKMISHLLISVSLFSFLVSYSSSLLHPSPKFHPYFSASSFHLLTHALSKNCLFLVCNGLLVFLAKTSGLIRPPASHDLDDKRIADALMQTALDRFQLDETADAVRNRHRDRAGDDEGDQIGKEVSIFIAESEEERGEDERDSADGNRPDSASSWLFQDDVEELYGLGDEEGDDDDDDDDVEKKEEIMSTEEMNRKFEDFIRKMKEEIIISEARHKVLMLNSPN
ncbi:hypothetical protein SASPL_130418 [Salvia splendens]|uniref:Uncharacterized protein n=1 Tax=Salvia splendens TaxID=180675 RepID=A0A8X8ZJM4_SALSN|nr:protein bfr2-like [Salvia splendens]KAG6407427.1 hypothetical protein SASPL_130418 [Salvia splendens]